MKRIKYSKEERQHVEEYKKIYRKMNGIKWNEEKY